MYNYYDPTSSIFYGISDIYLVSTVTIILAVIIALYCSNFLKDNEALQQAQEDAYQSYAYTEDEAELDQVLRAHLAEQSESDSVDEDEDEYDDDDIDENNKQRLHKNDSDSSLDDFTSVDAGLVSRLKSSRLKVLEAQLTNDQLAEERRIEREQMAAIFELLKKQEVDLNMKEIDENELNAQLNLYR